MGSDPRYFESYRAAQSAATELARSTNQSISVFRDGNGWAICATGKPNVTAVSKAEFDANEAYSKKLVTANVQLKAELNAARDRIESLVDEIGRLTSSLNELSKSPETVREELRSLMREKVALDSKLLALKGEIVDLRQKKKSLHDALSEFVDEKARIMNSIEFEKKALTTLQRAVKNARASLGDAPIAESLEHEICLACGGAGGVRGGCRKCDGKGWL